MSDATLQHKFWRDQPRARLADGNLKNTIQIHRIIHSFKYDDISLGRTHSHKNGEARKAGICELLKLVGDHSSREGRVAPVSVGQASANFEPFPRRVDADEPIKLLRAGVRYTSERI